jgi:hypothetical protein
MWADGADVWCMQSMEASGLELKLKHKIKKSAETNGVEQYQPAMLDKHQPKRRKQEQQQLVKVRATGGDCLDALIGKG